MIPGQGREFRGPCGYFYPGYAGTGPPGWVRQLRLLPRRIDPLGCEQLTVGSEARGKKKPLQRGKSTKWRSNRHFAVYNAKHCAMGPAGIEYHPRMGAYDQ